MCPMMFRFRFHLLVPRENCFVNTAETIGRRRSKKTNEKRRKEALPHLLLARVLFFDCDVLSEPVGPG